MLCRRFLYCTNKRANTLKEKLSNLYGSSIHVKGSTGKVIATFKPEDISFKKKDKMSMIIESEYIRELSKKLNEIKYKLEQLRALDNEIKINVAFAKSYPIGVDTKEDFVAIKKIMEYKSK